MGHRQIGLLAGAVVFALAHTQAPLYWSNQNQYFLHGLAQGGLGDLRLVPEEFDDLMHQSMDAGTLKHPVPYHTYVDDSFAKAARPAVISL